VTDARALNDPAHVRLQYESEAGLAARKAAYRDVTGPDPREAAFDAVVAASPTTILEVGCGEGELAERLARETTATVVAIDQSERMVELTRGLGVDARVADVQELPFADGAFEAVLAGWMLYHVPDLDRGLGEVARVLAPGGRLVATTNASDHLVELLALGELERWSLPFGAENGEEKLRRHFDDVDRIDLPGTVTFADIEAVRSYFASSDRLAPALERLPTSLAEPLVARRSPVLFVATKRSG
jgi:SAM-dependent methyltransferase